MELLRLEGIFFISVSLVFSSACTTNDDLVIDEGMNTVDSVAALNRVPQYFTCQLGKEESVIKMLSSPLMHPHVVQELHLLMETLILSPHSERSKTCRRMESTPLPQPWSTGGPGRSEKSHGCGPLHLLRDNMAHVVEAMLAYCMKFQC